MVDFLKEFFNEPLEALGISQILHVNIPEEFLNEFLQPQEITGRN